MVDSALPPSTSATTSTTTATPAAAPTATASSGMPSLEQLKKICPDSNASNLQKYFPLIAKEMVAYQMLTKNQLIAFIGNIYTETRPFAPIPEGGKGGGKHGQFYGRGFIQITHEEGYRIMGKLLGLDLLSNPDLALKPDIAAKIACMFWSGQGGYPDIRPYAEKQDWANCRSLVNAGRTGLIGKCWGTEIYFPCVKRAEAILTSGLDPTAVGSASLGADYGMGCIDTGGAPLQNLSGTHAPGSGIDAMSIALGLHMQELNRAITFHGYLNVPAKPEILDLEPQKTFKGKNFGKDFNDIDYTVEEIIFYADDNLEAEIVAHAGEILPSRIQVFNNGAPSTAQAMGDAGLAATPAAGAVAGDGSISSKLYASAMAAYKEQRSSAAGPDGGNLACAWAINNFCIIPNGLKPISSNPNYVPTVEAALKSGRGQLVSRAEAIPGDIWVAPNTAHIGICTEQGCTSVLSNSSSKAKFTWLDKIDSVNRYYGGGAERIYRLTN